MCLCLNTKAGRNRIWQCNGTYWQGENPVCCGKDLVSLTQIEQIFPWKAFWTQFSNTTPSSLRIVTVMQWKQSNEVSIQDNHWQSQLSSYFQLLCSVVLSIVPIAHIELKCQWTRHWLLTATLWQSLPTRQIDPPSELWDAGATFEFAFATAWLQYYEFQKELQQSLQASCQHRSSTAAAEDPCGFAGMHQTQSAWQHLYMWREQWTTCSNIFCEIHEAKGHANTKTQLWLCWYALRASVYVEGAVNNV